MPAFRSQPIARCAGRGWPACCLAAAVLLLAAPLGAQTVAIESPAGQRTWSLPLPAEEDPAVFSLPPRPAQPPLPFAAPPAYAVETIPAAPPPAPPVAASPADLATETVAAPTPAPVEPAPAAAPPALAAPAASATETVAAPATVEPDPGPSLSVLGGLPDYVQSPTSLEPVPEPGPSSFDGIEVQKLAPLPGDPSVLANEGAPAGAAGEPETYKLRDMLRTLMAEDAVLAVVQGQEIRWGEVARSAEGLPEEYRNKLESLFPALLQRMIDLTLLSQEGRRRGLANDPEVARRLQVFEDQIIREVLLERYVAEAQTEAALRQAYAAYIARESAHVTVKARHILVGSEVTANELIKQLDAGADFATLARTRSLGSSATRGGDLGTFELGRMVPAFAEAIATIPVGSYTRRPVHTDFGWHVILLESRSGGDYPSFESVEPQLRDEVARRAIAQLLRTLRGTADIQIIGAEKADDGAGPTRADLVDQR